MVSCLVFLRLKFSMLTSSILGSFSGRLISHVHGLSYKRAFPVSTSLKPIYRYQHREHKLLLSRERVNRVNKGTKRMNSSPVVISYLTRFYRESRCLQILRKAHCSANLVPRPFHAQQKKNLVPRPFHAQQKKNLVPRPFRAQQKKKFWFV